MYFNAAITTAIPTANVSFLIQSKSVFIVPISVLMLSVATVRSALVTTLISVIFQVASLLAALAHPGHIVCYAPGDSLPCRRDAS
ncbi:hypothetical protein CKY06_02250 [Photorhabdus sp. S15-56]|nr:hypothetical protein PluTT01m_09085 [Photorhabdus laumondii subsp. laumondii]RAW71026.1 hypothetical protein CKY14_13330 [Photorhabdus sp. S14-60]RAW74699.1 hypothetical protein CKY15_02730 [Photorhabdus sp. S7-51]RAW80020.1 hypothetical protein CKY06_02250 [Photorhabdus sp. S15-56]